MLIRRELRLFFAFTILLCNCLSPDCKAVAAEPANRSAAKTEGKLLVTGSSTMCVMMAEIGQRFQSLHRGVQVDVQCGGSERGLMDIIEGKAHIGMVSRSLADKEQNLFGFPIARDGVSVIVHKNNPVKSLSNAQVVGIFTGKVTSWEKVGGSKTPITVLLRESQKSSTELFTKYYKLKAAEIKGKVVNGDNPASIKAMASNNYAIGYTSSGFAEREALMGRPIKILPVNGMMPTHRNIITGNYPISRPLMLVTSKLPSGLAKEFIDFSLSSSVVDIIEKYEYVPYQD